LDLQAKSDFKLYFVNIVNYKIYMNEFNKNTQNQITEQDIKEHRSRGIYLRDDHCDWGSSGMNEMSSENNDQNQNS
jgi:hypothetical protein